MAERAILEAVRAYLAAGGLTPAPAHIGVVEPAAAGDLPSVVLSLEATRRDGLSVGRRAVTVEAPPALPFTARIDLAQPFLPDAPGFSLVSEDRLSLILPYGGLVRADGSEGAITAADLTCTADGVARPVVTGTPTGMQCRCEPVEGTLAFDTPLPPTGLVDLSFFLGRWEQELTRVTGTLRIDVVGAAAVVVGLSDQIVELLTGDRARAAIRRLMALEVTALSSVGVDPIATAFRRVARLGFAFEHERNTPESSGRVIRSIPVVTELSAPST